MATTDPDIITALDDGLLAAAAGRKVVEIDDQSVERFGPVELLRARKMMAHDADRQDGTVPPISKIDFGGVF